MNAPPTGLRVEHLDSPLGILTTSPRLSWKLPGGARRQHAYRVTADNGWDSGWVESDRTLLVPYSGSPLTSAQRVEWQVAVRTDIGESPVSDAAWFETGLLRTDDWAVLWVEPGQMPGGAAGERPAALLRFEFDLNRPVLFARLYATAQGIYEAFLNGTRVGDVELTPGYTQYDERLQVQTYDVTDMVAAGANALGVMLADGWFRGQTGVTRAADQWGARLAFLAQLQLTHDDGSTTVIGNGEGWRSSVGHVVAADLIAGEHWDLTQMERGWTMPGFDDGAWQDAVVVDHGFGGLVDSPAPPVRRIEEIVPVSVNQLPDGRQVVDLGQNINGWIQLRKLGPAGTTTTLTHGEWLDINGDVTVHNLQPDLPFLPQPLPAGQVDRVVSSGEPGDVFEPRRTTHGFQYVRIEGHLESLTVDDVRGVFVHTDMRRTGWFSSSDERLDAFHDAAVRSFRGNACDIPTDCPHRERHGWTGDWQLYVPTAAFLYDVAGLSTKWLRDVAVTQWPDGVIANVSPTPGHEGREGPLAFLNGSAGWGDAAVIVPWEIYRSYGDEQVLSELWPTMVRWLDRAEQMAREQRHPSRSARRPVPGTHEQFIWDTGFHWGEWLEPGNSPEQLDQLVAADHGDVATAYFAHSAGLMARIAAVLGKVEDARRYRDLAENVREAWQAEYLDGLGRLTPDTQANHVRALAFDLIPTELRHKVAGRLVELIRQADTHLGTGFLSTPYLLPVLAESGHLAVAYELLFQDSEPGWLVMVDRGSSTIWEHWDGVSPNGVAHDSLNHYSKGAVVSFLHHHVAGIELLEPAYRRFRVRPRPGGGLSSAGATHESPYGLVRSAWRRSSDTFELDVVVPPGTEAEVLLPDGTTRTAGPGQHAFTCTIHEEKIQ